jgi:ADP-heptose:LPS heptosyltransferase
VPAPEGGGGGPLAGDAGAPLAGPPLASDASGPLAPPLAADAALPLAGALVPGVERIAVLRANALGDLLFCLPALERLKLAYPAAELVLLGCPWHAELLGGRPGPVDRVVVVPPSRGVRGGPDAEEDPAELDGFFAAMRAERFDLALQLHGGGRFSTPFVRRLGARLTAGLRDWDAPPLDRWLRYVYYQAERVRYLEAVALVGATYGPLEPRLAVTDADRREAAPHLPAGRALAVLHPGASDGRRRWPPARFAAVGDALATDGLAMAVTGSAGEAALVAEVVARMARPAANLAGALSLGGLAGLLEGAALLVANDTGPMHLAGAVGGPSVGIYWVGNVITGAPLVRANHRPVAAFRTACPVCGTDCIASRCEHDASFVADVAMEEVLRHARDLLSASRASAPRAAA